MARKPSTETELRRYKGKYHDLNRKLDAMVVERNAFLNRATTAERELAEWKRRFDALLLRTPTSRAEPEGGEGKP